MADWFDEKPPKSLDDKILRAIEPELLRNKASNGLGSRRHWLLALGFAVTAAAVVVVSRRTIEAVDELQLADFVEDEILVEENLELLAQTETDFEDQLEMLEALEDLEALEEGDV
jgi:hypothetical protein